MAAMLKNFVKNIENILYHSWNIYCHFLIFESNVRLIWWFLVEFKLYRFPHFKRLGFLWNLIPRPIPKAKKWRGTEIKLGIRVEENNTCLFLSLIFIDKDCSWSVWISELMLPRSSCIMKMTELSKKQLFIY